MGKEYAYIDVGATNTESSEAYTQAWIERVVAQSTLEPQAKALIRADALIPVEFSIFDTDDSQRQPIIVEHESLPLWHILNDRFPWQAYAGKQQNTDSVQTKVLMPYFYGEVARELNFTRFFLGRIQVGGQIHAGFWVQHELMMPNQAVLKTEVVVLSVWNTHAEMMAEIWFDLPPTSLGANQWPKAISLEWPGMRIGAQSGSRFDYSADTSQNRLWLKPFEEPVGVAILSILPRWTLKDVQLPDTHIEPNQLLKVTLGNLPGDAPALEYSITVAQEYRASGRWQYYLAVYLNHRCPWVNCGVMDEEGVIRAQSDQQNFWFVRSDASQASFSIHILPGDLAQWLEGVPTSIQPVTPPKAWQKWDNLLSSVWNAELSKDYIQNLIERCLNKSGLPQRTQDRFRDEKRFRYKYQVGYPVYSAGMTAYAPPRYKHFSFLQVLTGEPQRTAYFQETIANIHVSGEPLSSVEVRTLGRLRDILYETFVADIDELARNTDYKQLFGETCEALAKVRAAQFLVDDAEQDVSLRELAHRFLKGEVKPRLLLFREKVVPNALVLKLSSQKALLISLNMAELTWAVWQPSGVAGQPSDDLMRFITHHLPFPEKLSVERSDFYPQKKRYGYHYRRVPPQPVSFREVTNINDALYEIGISELKHMMNYAVFSSDEERRLAKWGMFKVATRAVSSLVIAAVGPASGVGALLLSGGVGLIANVADASFSYQLARSMDRPEDYAAYVYECKLGVLLGVVELVADVTLARGQLRTLLKRSAQTGKLLLPALRSRERPDTPVSLEQASASTLFLPTSADLLGMRGRLEKLYRDANKLAELAGDSEASTTGGFVESKRCADYLSSQSWDVQAIGVLLFAEPDDPRPQCHFALSVRNESDAAVLDTGLGRLDPSAQQLAYFDSIAGWEQRVQQAPASSGKLVVYKLYANVIEASHELNTVFRLGVSWGRFFNTGSYSVLACPQRFITAIQRQLPRLWDVLSRELPGGASQLTTALQNTPQPFDHAGLLLQVSNLRGLIDESEDMLRRTVGVPVVGNLRAQLLGAFRSWRHESLEEYVELMDSVIAEEAELVRGALAHLDQLQSGLASPIATAENALVDCVDWIALRAGQEDDDWRSLLRSEIERYVTGDRARADLCTRAQLDYLHQTLAAHREVQIHHVLGASYERLSMSTGQALFAIGLKLINAMATHRQSDCFFALIMTCQPYENSNEHFARIIYGIHALRQKRFMVLTQAHENRLSGLRPAEPVPL
ncbi:hypothetical protein [Pseudomonas sp. NIBRBAC000502773]|uniref:hypothetical protein n=1 Tax=Pseudomonas sp. NIBRBAC000502773 TaxID=2590776 RepID=UPI00113192F7|nr:hypothetical protein [Pseudomonas sp. NIBRBAC000502773]QDG60674.1 hypothetical protein NIBR502773_30555 [Pseudomonas sp. NIBRBAC000502773]